MGEIKVTIDCCLCSQETTSTVIVRDGWETVYDTIYEDRGFCPEHSAVSRWQDAQCPGCVGSWGDCRLWRSFAHDERDLTDGDFTQISQGVCPKRTNGSFLVPINADGMKIEHPDMSERATTEEGEALVKAIKDYWERYPID